MFERIFTYSSFEAKKNKIFGLGNILKLILLLFPLIGLTMSLISAYLFYISPLTYEVVYYFAGALFVIFIGLFMFRWLNELFTVYAIGKDGNFYRFKTLAFAMSYLGIGTMAGEIASKGQGRVVSLFELMYKVKETIQKIDSEEKIVEMCAAGYLCELKDIKVISKSKNGIEINGVLDNRVNEKKVKYKIRKVYEDSDNLLGFFEHLASQPGEKYEYINKTKAEDLMLKKPGYMLKVAKQSYWIVMVTIWLSLIMYSGELHKIALGAKSAIDVKPVLVLFAFFETIILVINIKIPSKSSQ